MVANNRPNDPGSGIYIDAENLGDEVKGTNIVRYALADWDRDLPRITSISLYGRGVQIWKAALDGLVEELQGPWPFANSRPTVEVIDASGNGRFRDKNTADIKLAMDACQDMLSGRAGFIAVLSNDSDFFALYQKADDLKLNGASGCPNLALSSIRPPAPFLLINHPLSAGVSGRMAGVPGSHRKVLPEESQYAPVTVTEEEIAEAIVAKVDVGLFDNSRIQEVIKDDPALSKHPNANLQGEAFDKFVAESVWPPLSTHGVSRYRSMPVGYVMTEDAKSNLDREFKESGPTSAGLPSDQEFIPSDQEVIDAFVQDRMNRGLIGGGFRAPQLLAFITKTWPDHPYAGSYVSPFDNHFLFPLITRSQGTSPVKILISRPRIYRLYEISPNARRQGEDPTLNDMAKEIVMNLSLESFKPEEVQEVIKSRWAQCEFARLPSHFFNTQFYFQIWPLLCDDRDAGLRAADKPEDDKYELSDVAIQQLRNRFGLTSEESA